MSEATQSHVAVDQYTSLVRGLDFLESENVQILRVSTPEEIAAHKRAGDGYCPYQTVETVSADQFAGKGILVQFDRNYNKEYGTNDADTFKITTEDGQTYLIANTDSIIPEALSSAYEAELDVDTLEKFNSSNRLNLEDPSATQAVFDSNMVKLKAAAPTSAQVEVAAVAAPPVESEIVVRVPEAAPPPVPPSRPTAPAEPVAARSEPVEPVVARSEPAVAKPPVQSEIVVDGLAQSFEDPHFGGEVDVTKVPEDRRGVATTAAKKMPDFLADNQRMQALIDFTKPGGAIENMNPMEALGHMCSIIMGPEKGAQFMNIISPVIEGLEKGGATKIVGNTPAADPAAKADAPSQDAAASASMAARSDPFHPSNSLSI